MYGGAHLVRRYPMPHRASLSTSNQWWSRDVGPAHIISLCSYAGTKPGSLQHRWLLRDLAKVDRSRTPWLIVMMHVPWHHSNTGHRDEAEAMRLDMERPLYEYGVDLVVAGHIHAYERTHAMYQGKRNRCGAVHLMLGDGGNREGAYVPWQEPAPEWSAFREASFGSGALTLVNATHARFDGGHSDAATRRGGLNLRIHLSLNARYDWSRTACEVASRPDGIELKGRQTCVSNATGPYQWGGDNSATASAPEDARWIVRPVQRAPRKAGCVPPAEDGWGDEPTLLPAAPGGSGGVGVVVGGGEDSDSRRGMESGGGRHDGEHGTRCAPDCCAPPAPPAAAASPVVISSSADPETGRWNGAWPVIPSALLACTLGIASLLLGLVCAKAKEADENDWADGLANYGLAAARPAEETGESDAEYVELTVDLVSLRG